MATKVEKLNEAYEYLRSFGKVHTKKDFANEIDFDKTNMSSAFSGDDRYLTDNLFKKICYKYPNLFNIEYFLSDKGEMIKNNQQIGNVSNSTVVGANVNGNNISLNDFSEIINLQKGYQDLLKKKDEHVSELISIISKLTNNEK